MGDPPRIQVKLNGRRFEFARDVALANCGLFRDWDADADAARRACPAPFVHERVVCGSQASDAGGGGGGGSSVSGGGAAAAAEPASVDVFTFSEVPSMAADYFGSIQVALRKGRRPPFIWKDLNHGEQTAIAWIVRTFGIAGFAEFTCVTAPDVAPEIAAARYNARYRDELARAAGGDAAMAAVANAAADAAQARAANDVATVVDGAVRPSDDRIAHLLAFAHLKAMTPTPAERQQGAAAAAADAVARAAAAARAADDDDENLVMSGVGCYHCGLSTHSVGECPHRDV
jgi:hypothetical protein